VAARSASEHGHFRQLKNEKSFKARTNRLAIGLLPPFLSLAIGLLPPFLSHARSHSVRADLLAGHHGAQSKK
jgi:hypothetical protein